MDTINRVSNKQVGKGAERVPIEIRVVAGAMNHRVTFLDNTADHGRVPPDGDQRVIDRERDLLVEYHLLPDHRHLARSADCLVRLEDKAR